MSTNETIKRFWEEYEPSPAPKPKPKPAPFSKDVSLFTGALVEFVDEVAE